MPIYGNIGDALKSTESGFAATAPPEVFGAFVDTLYNYGPFLKHVESHGIASFPDGLPALSEVAIVGAGPAGLVAAHELLRAGVTPVIYEATDRLGGRSWSRGFEGSDAIAEMGAMRFPATAAFMHYVDRFGLKFGGQFPNPGVSKTLLYYRNEAFPWQGGPPPGPFAAIRNDWIRFVENLGALELARLLADSQYDEARARWQQLINKYANTSFVNAIANGIPKWGPPEFNAFGALGIGTGGFSPLFNNNFLEFIRLIVNGLESNQQLLLDGISQLPEMLYRQPVDTPDGQHVSLKDKGALSLESPVYGIRHLQGAHKPVRLYLDQARTKHRDFTCVIVATTTRAMQLMGLTLTNGSEGALTESTRTALRGLHLVNSSKMFIRTKSKFWKEDESLPNNIQTDEAPRGIYCLDYEDRTDHGVVVISYTWGDDSTKLLAVEPRQRFDYFRDIIARIDRRFAEHLEPVNGEILTVDWQLEMHQYGAFKLQYPAQDASLQAAYCQFLSVLDPGADKGVYLAGDSVSWAGGWIEGALQTGLNAACAVAKRLGGQLIADSPLSQDPGLYNYQVS